MCLFWQSPERLKARMEEIAAAVERERAAVAEAERRLRDLQARLDTIAKVRASLAPGHTPPRCMAHCRSAPEHHRKGVRQGSVAPGHRSY